MPPSQALFMVRHLSSPPEGPQDETKLQGLARRAGRRQGQELPMGWVMPELPVKDGPPAAWWEGRGVRDRGGCAPARSLIHPDAHCLSCKQRVQAGLWPQRRPESVWWEGREQASSQPSSWTPPNGVGLSPSPTADPGVVVGLCLNMSDRVAAEAGWGQAGPPARSRPQAHRWPAGRTTPPHVVTQVEWGHTAPSPEGALAWLPTPPQVNAHSHTLTLTHTSHRSDGSRPEAPQSYL